MNAVFVGRMIRYGACAIAVTVWQNSVAAGIAIFFFLITMDN